MSPPNRRCRGICIPAGKASTRRSRSLAGEQADWPTNVATRSGSCAVNPTFQRVIANQWSGHEPNPMGRRCRGDIPARRKQNRPAGQMCGRAGFPVILLLCFMSHRTYDRHDKRPGHCARHLLLTSNLPDCAQIDAGDGSCHHSPVARVAAGDP